jgi:twinkle protein
MLLQVAAYHMFVLGQSVAIASLEEPFEKVIMTIIKQGLGYHPDIHSRAYKEAYDLIQDKLVIFNELGNTTVDEVLEFFEYSVKKDGVHHCILDSLTCTDIDLDGDRKNVNKMIQKIIDSTNRSGAHYHIVAHPVKGNDEDYKEMPHVYSIKGIQEIVARAYNVIIVWRNKARDGSIENLINNKKQPDEAQKLKERVGDTIIKVAKNRNGKTLGQIHSWFNMDNDRFRPQYGSYSDRVYFVPEDKNPD